MKESIAATLLLKSLNIYAYFFLVTVFCKKFAKFSTILPKDNTFEKAKINEQSFKLKIDTYFFKKYV